MVDLWLNNLSLKREPRLEISVIFQHPKTSEPNLLLIISIQIVSTKNYIHEIESEPLFHTLCQNVQMHLVSLISTVQNKVCLNLGELCVTMATYTSVHTCTKNSNRFISSSSLLPFKIYIQFSLFQKLLLISTKRSLVIGFIPLNSI